MLEATTQDPWAAELMRTTYAPMRCTAKPANALAFIPKHDGFAGAFYAVRDIFAKFAAQTPSSVALYGASIARNGKGALLLGPPAVGKSVLALNLAYCGAHFLGDETALFNLRSGEICAVPRRPSLREPGLPYLLDETGRANVAACKRAYCTEAGRFWYALDFAKLRLRPQSGAYPLRAVFVLADRGAQSSARSLSLSERVPAFVRRIHGRGCDLTRLAALHGLLRDVPAYRVCIGPPAGTAELLLRTLEQCG